MAYVRLQLPQGLPSNVASFIYDHIDPQYSDVHAMLRLPFPEHAPMGGCNFAATNTIMALISGLSSLTCDKLDTTNQSGPKFKEVLRDYYPWSPDTPPSSRKRMINHMYDFLRNPLAHSLGVRTKGNFLVRLLKINMSEVGIEALETSGTTTPALVYEPTEVNDEQIEDLQIYVAFLYIHVRKMLLNMLSDDAMVKTISTNLRSVGLN